MINIRDTIISQYANSPRLLSIIQSADQCISAQNDINKFYNDIWNITTAKGHGLDVWGRIVGVERKIKLVESNNYLGFEDGFLGFDDGVWISGGDSGYKLKDEQYRQLIIMKAMSNITYATAYHINTFLLSIFSGRGRAYFLKTGTMKARYVFEFSLTTIEKEIIIRSGILPRPTGVSIDFYEEKSNTYFGYEEAQYSPFNSGVFFME